MGPRIPSSDDTSNTSFPFRLETHFSTSVTFQLELACKFQFGLTDFQSSLPIKSVHAAKRNVNLKILRTPGLPIAKAPSMYTFLRSAPTSLLTPQAQHQLPQSPAWRTQETSLKSLHLKSHAVVANYTKSRFTCF